jgi:FAD/FMN-containing dehydrogenase
VNAMLAPTRATIDEHALRAFGAALRGQLISPVDPDYSQARKVWNGMIDRRPALIVRCAGAGDVLAAVGFARTTGLPVAVRGGGHSAAGNGVCEGGLVVDLSRMKGLRVDPIARAARAEPGLTWSEFDAETQAFGLATTGGGVSTTGVAGLTLGGGLGWLMRKHGLTCDNLLAADVVTADGRLLHVSRTEHPDLFWGLRGGGGNFGVVTSFEYRLHPVDVVLAGTVTFPFAEAADVVRFFREFTADAPDELTCYLNLAGDPELGAVVAIDVCYAGPTEEGEAALRPLRQLRSPLSDNIAPRRYRDFNATDPATVFPHGARNYWKSSFMRDLSDDAIETLIRRLQVAPSLDTCCLVVEQMGGAINRVAPDATAFPHRDVVHNLVIVATGFAAAEDDRHIAWVRETWAAMRPFTRDAVYLNYLGEEEMGRVGSAYGASTYARLAALKRAYDPDNLFRVNHNVPPAERDDA